MPHPSITSRPAFLLLSWLLASTAIVGLVPRVAHAEEPSSKAEPAAPTWALPPPAATAAPAPAASPPAAPPASSVRITYESTHVDRPAEATATPKSPDDSTFLHGFRLGYGFVTNYDKPVPSFDGQSLAQKAKLRSPHHFLLGYEVVYRVVGHSWLNVLLLGNVMLAGLEQSRFLPSGNFLIGFELKNAFQLGVGANVSPLKGSEAHTIIAAGWTPKVGSIYTPVHFFFIPDVDGVNRLGVTTGVTF